MSWSLARWKVGLKKKKELLKNSSKKWSHFKHGESHATRYTVLRACVKLRILIKMENNSRPSVFPKRLLTSTWISRRLMRSSISVNNQVLKLFLTMKWTNLQVCISQQWLCAYLTIKSIKQTCGDEQFSRNKATEITRGSQWSNTESDPYFYSGKYCTHLSVKYFFFPVSLSIISQWKRTNSLALDLCFNGSVNLNSQTIGCLVLEFIRC